MAEMYKNIKTGVKAELVEINEKSKQVTLKKADGKFTASNLSSFEKYWKKICDDVAEKKADMTVEKSEPVQKEAEQPAKVQKPKKEKAEKSAEENIEAKKSLIEKLSKTYPEIKIDDKYFSLKVGERTAFAGEFGRKDIRVCTIADILPADIGFKTRKSALNAVIRVQYSESDNLFTMIKYADDNFKDSDILKKKRKGKEKSEKAETKEIKKVEKEKK